MVSRGMGLLVGEKTNHHGVSDAGIRSRMSAPVWWFSEPIWRFPSHGPNPNSWRLYFVGKIEKGWSISGYTTFFLRKHLHMKPFFDTSLSHLGCSIAMLKHHRVTWEDARSWEPPASLLLHRTPGDSYPPWGGGPYLYFRNPPYDWKHVDIEKNSYTPIQLPQKKSTNVV